ncbi:MAG: SPOR domain-containing protein [Zoogloeaceae bacterium]|jgi:DedD protein|nr:SPOR domain-containing protein [Zoogloeaceae bacterium]
MNANKSSSNSPVNADHETEQRNIIVRRLTLAAILVLVLLGLLKVFDTLGTREGNEQPPFQNPVPTPPKRQIDKPVTRQPTPGAEPEESPAIPEPASGEDTLPPPEMPPVPTPPPPLPQPPTPTEATPAPPSPPVAQPPQTRPAARPPVATRPSPPAVPPFPLPPTPGVVPPEFTAPLPPSETPAPLPPLVQPTPQNRLPAVRPQPVTPLRIFSGYLVQAGVFTNVQRAEEIHAKLTLHGIPSTLETRVQVGPFKTQAEAEAAHKKMRELGIEGVILPPRSP